MYHKYSYIRIYKYIKNINIKITQTGLEDKNIDRLQVFLLEGTLAH
jgi:hypothetical protein